jgi:diguanylate cyclase (GGDEF)-like protein
MNNINELNKILEDKSITTLYQPIVNLKNGEVLGYEALSRGPLNSPLFSPDKLFKTAEDCNLLWDLEQLCRTKALENSYSLEKDKFLFLNVDPLIMKDPKFKQGFTKEFLQKHNIVPESIIFEITERTSISDYKGFKNVINNYVDQGYKIAIDDIGSGYSGLTTLAEVRPHYIKIDMELIRDIDKDNFKQALIKTFVTLAENTNMKLIAEGIETKDELRTLIGLNVYAGQGFFLQKPSPAFNEIPKSITDLILHIKENLDYSFGISKHYIGQIISEDQSFTESVSCKLMKDYFSLTKATGACIVDGNDSPVGLVMEHTINSNLATQYGHAVFGKRPVSIIMDRNPLIVDFNTPISTVSKVAMERDNSTLYDYVIVTKKGRYSGIVTIKTLLEYTTTLERNYAKELNPLTGLPGNTIIFNVLSEIITMKKNFCILYFDLNNFKIYNDTYGFENGDRVIKFTANIIGECIKSYFPFNSFVGHIGGDDFISIIEAPFESCIDVCKSFICKFDKTIVEFFNEKDRLNGYIIAHDRKGNKDVFSLTSISIAGMYGNFKSFSTADEISKYITSIKKQVKEKKKSSYFIEDINKIS